MVGNDSSRSIFLSAATRVMIVASIHACTAVTGYLPQSVVAAFNMQSSPMSMSMLTDDSSLVPHRNSVRERLPVRSGGVGRQRDIRRQRAREGIFETVVQAQSRSNVRS